MLVLRIAQKARKNCFNSKNSITIIPKPFTTNSENNSEIEIKKVEGNKIYKSTYNLERKYYDFIKSHNIKVSDFKIMPFMEFPKEFGPKNFVKHLKKALPVINPFQTVLFGNGIDGRNIIAAGPNGIGKTTSSAILMLAHIHKNKQNLRPHSPIALILVNSSVEGEIVFKKIVEMAQAIGVVGAHQSQLENFLVRQRPMVGDFDFLICSPEMIMQAVEMKKLNLGQVSFVIGEDMTNFEEDDDIESFRQVLNNVNPKKQCVFIADKFSEKILAVIHKSLSSSFLMKLEKDPLLAKLLITSSNLFIEGELIFSRLIKTIRIASSTPGNKTIVLCDKDYQCEEISRKMDELSIANYCFKNLENPFLFDEKMFYNRVNLVCDNVIVTTDLCMPTMVKDIEFDTLIVYDFKEGVKDLVQKINGFRGKKVKLVVIVSKENQLAIDEMSVLERHQDWLLNHHFEEILAMEPLEEPLQPIDYEAALA